MPCYHPLPAWRRDGALTLREVQGWADGSDPDVEYLRLPCGSCVGCRAARAQAWALRCRLELSQHAASSVVTLTYADSPLLPDGRESLRPRDLQLFFKRLRRSGPPIRYFASGEYGDQLGRPHYHAILFGLPPSEWLCREAWRQGRVHVDEVSPAAVAYVAGYVSKKLRDVRQRSAEQVDPSTGEVYQWQPPFLRMSRRPGVGAAARQHWRSWRSFAMLDGRRMAVPRYLHEAWLANVDDIAIARLAEERKELPALSYDQLYHAELHAQTLHTLQSSRRTI